MSRAQSSVIGVAILLGITVVAMGTMTAGLGAIVSENAAATDAARVASDLDGALNPVEVTGYDEGRVSFTDGTLRPVSRTLRVWDRAAVVAQVEVDGLVFETGDRRVAWVAGVITRGRPGEAWVHKEPPITASRDVLIVGAPRLNTSGVSVSGSGETSVVLESVVSHNRTDLEDGVYTISLETETPDALRRSFGSNRTRVRDIDGDGVPSVLVRYPGTRTGYLVVHDVEVTFGRA